MNLFSGLWAGVKAVIGIGGAAKGSSNVMEVAKGVGNFIDEQNYTEEEKAVNNLKMVEHFGAFMENTVNENSQRSITRRDLAIWIIRVELGLLVFSAILFKFDKPWGDYVYKICTDSPLGLLTLGVGAFFFGTHLLRSAKTGK